MQNNENRLPQVSVIIPNYNHALYLRERIESVLTQTFSDFEVIILDDASSDNSKQIIKEYVLKDKRISFYQSNINSGSPFIQWNKGVGLAKADLIWIAESDDVASPQFLNEMVAKHHSHPNVAIAYSQSNRITKEGVIEGTWKTFTDDLNPDLFSDDFTMNGMDFINEYLIVKNVIPNASAVVFKKSVYNEVKGADEKLKTNSDWLTWLKMLLQHDVAFVAKPLNNFRYHPESVIAKAVLNGRGSYVEQHDLTMRRAFEAFCNASSITLTRELKKNNKKYQSFDYGKKGIYQVNKGEYVAGFLNLCKASLSPKPTLGYLKRLLKGQ